MTLENMIDDVWEALGEESDIDPYDGDGNIDTTSSGFVKLRRVLNRAQVQVSQWKDPSNNRLVRFSELLGEMYFEHQVLSGQVLGISDSGEMVDIDVEDDSSLTSDELTTKWGDRYNGWMLEIGNEQKLVVDTSMNGAYVRVTVHDGFDSAEAGDDYTMAKRFNWLLPSGHRWADEHITLPENSDLFVAEGNLISPLKVIDLYSSRELSPAVKKEGFPTMHTSLGDPGQWYFFGKKLYFDTVPDTDRWFKMEYYRNPVALVNASDEPEIPDQYHYGLVLWTIEWGYRRNGESGDKYSTKRDFIDFMRSVKGTDDMIPMRTETGGRLRMRR